MVQNHIAELADFPQQSTVVSGKRRHPEDEDSVLGVNNVGGAACPGVTS